MQLSPQKICDLACCVTDNSFEHEQPPVTKKLTNHIVFELASSWMGTDNKLEDEVSVWWPILCVLWRRIKWRGRVLRVWREAPLGQSD
jgi:hypothetical protein